MGSLGSPLISPVQIAVSRLNWKFAREQGTSALGLFFRGLVLDDIPTPEPQAGADRGPIAFSPNSADSKAGFRIYDSIRR